MSNSLNYTPQQAEAIYSKGGPILVSAGAGSGKTRVLVQHLLHMLEEGGDITEYLVITYTKAAAAELKTRILDGINNLLAQDPANTALRRQSHLIHKANIGTIHSFCIGIVRENVHLLDISPDVRVIDGSEAKALMRSVLKQVIENKYDSIGKDKSFRALVDTMGAGRDDTKLFEIVLETYEKIQSHPYPDDWMAEQLNRLNRMDFTGDAAETAWGKIILSRAINTAAYWKKRLQRILDDGETEFLDAYGESLTGTVYSLSQFITAAGKSWDEAAARANISFLRPKNIKGYEDYKELRKRCKSEMDKLYKSLSANSQELMQGMANVKPVISGLFSLVSEFGLRYSEEKRNRSCIDFSDQEHMAVSLLTDRRTMKPTQLAVSVSTRFKEIMVDEYQDVNDVQELIFSAISRDGKNIFMVGDVKQSIYGFRLADPSIFMAKYNTFSADRNSGIGGKILLSKNFRSRKAILDCVNYIFSNTMSDKFGGMNYTEDEYLQWGGSEPEDSNEPCIELDVLDTESEESDDYSKNDLEAEFVADRVMELSKTHPYKDIVILLRSVKDNGRRYADALSRRGIPVASDSGEGFYESLEITVMMSLLSVIDNPRQDVPLISVLRSPIYGFTADELAEIRTADAESDFYTALCKTADSMEKAKAFLLELGHFRDESSEMSADRLIWHIYDRTGYLSIAAAMDKGEERVKNLMCLFEYAKAFENSGYKGLFSFITYIRKQMERGDEPQRESADNTSGVRIMSIHKSKGLEFPVVILAGMAKRFNTSDTQRPLLIHPKLGAGPKLLEPKERIEYETLARRAVSMVLREEMLAEEMRILYVAMTRAVDKLIMTCAFGDCERHLRKLMADAALPVEPQVLSAVNCMADWVLLPAICRAEAEAIRYGEPILPYEDSDKWDIRLVKAKIEEYDLSETTDVSNEQEQTDADIAGKLNWKYPYAATDIPSKLTATELKGRFFDYEAMEEAEQLALAEQPINIREPDFVSADERTLSAAERGTALHLAMQYIDYKSCGNINGIEAELDRLENLGILNDKQRKAVNPWKIKSFFESKLGKRILNADKLYREFKFSLLVPADIWYNNAYGEEILLQGVVDCCIVENGEITIIDYKTDYVNDSTIAEKAMLYKKQLDAYQIAMEKITGSKTREKILYFFSAGREVILE